MYVCMYVYIYIYIHMTRRSQARSWCRPVLGGTQTGSYQTGSYQKGRFIPPKPGFWEQLRLIRPRLYASEVRVGGTSDLPGSGAALGAPRGCARAGARVFCNFSQPPRRGDRRTALSVWCADRCPGGACARTPLAL